tara:strand:- start:503 stop:1120 length:618 start_codon:yes stop_codon:yes gene_type:complete
MYWNNIKTQFELKKFTKSILTEIGMTDSIKTAHPKHYDFFLYMVSRHPDQSKFVDMADIFITRNKVTYHLECGVLNKNGFRSTFSIMNTCVSGKTKDNLKPALRNAIQSQIEIFRSNSELICDICLDTENIMHIDHFEPQFKTIVENFLKRNQLKVPTKFDSKPNNSACFKPNDYIFEKSFDEYHKETATLRVLCCICNSKRARA